jgi:hypothetical protein
MAEEKLVVLDPSGEKGSEKKKLMAERDSSLQGKRIGFLSNGKPNAGLLMQELDLLLSKQFRFSKVNHWEKPKASVRATFLDELARECQVVVNGVGD